jgi:signal transduction histidine kinase
MTELVNIDTIGGQRQTVISMLQDNRPSPLLRQVMKDGARLILRKDDNEGPTTVRFGDTARLSMSLMFVPVRIEDRNIGVLSVQSYRADAYTSHDLEILQGLADHVAGALARLQAESERKWAEKKLYEAQEALKAHAQALEETVARRTANLQETISELQHFSYALTHDMRAPLRAMQSFAEILEAKCGSADDHETLEYCRRIKTAAERMDSLIQDSLNYTLICRCGNLSSRSIPPFRRLWGTEPL